MSKWSEGWVRVFEVTEPTKHRKGFTVYKVISRVFHKNSIEGITEIVTYKRFSEFKKLHKSLSSLHLSLHLKGVIPSFPESKLFGRFDEEVVETRRQSALELLEFAAKHPPLFTSNVFVKFFENSTTNFTTHSTSQQVVHELSDDCHQLPQPLEPMVSLSPSDDWSQRSDLSDGSGYYSTQIHSLENSMNEQNCSKTQLTEFDPLANCEDSSDSSLNRMKDKENKNWFIYAIQSCDHQNEDSSQIKVATIDNEEEISFPKPFSDQFREDLDKEMNLNVTLNDIPIVSSELENNHLRDELNANDNQNDNSIQINENNSFVKTSEDLSKELIGASDETYLLDAATLIGQAQHHEEVLEYEAAFESYKCAVGILLQGVNDETDSEKKASIRRKTFQYLTRAEQIYDTYLNENQSFQPNRRWAPDSPFKALSSSFISSWFGSCHELTKFKVIGVISKLQLVIDTTTNNIFVIKVIYKTNIIDNLAHSSPQKPSLPQSIFPHDIPFMVQIYRIFKTEYALFLLLEFAKGGKLWDQMSSDSQTSPLSPCPDCTFVFDDREDGLVVDNPYRGRRLTRAQSESSANAFVEMQHNDEPLFSQSEAPKLCSPSGSLASIESIDYDIPSKSYSSLCNNYAFSQQRSEHSDVANCRLGSISDSIDSIDSITECDSKTPITSEQSRFRSLNQSKRQLSVESLGISGLLAKARGILRNVDETLRATKFTTKKQIMPNINSVNLRESKSEITLSQINSKTISEVFHQMDENNKNSIRRPTITEAKARVWLYQIVKCLQHLHKLGIIYCDLKPENLLLSESENIMISYKCFWNELPHNLIDDKARERLFVAPELNKSEKITHLCDWWSFGVISYELLTSRPLVSYHPNGITSHTLLYFPDFLSLEAKDLLNNLLQPNPLERLGRHGPEEIIAHPFFEGINRTLL